MAKVKAKKETYPRTQDIYRPSVMIDNNQAKNVNDVKVGDVVTLTGKVSRTTKSDRSGQKTTSSAEFEITDIISKPGGKK